VSVCVCARARVCACVQTRSACFGHGGGSDRGRGTGRRRQAQRLETRVLVTALACSLACLLACLLALVPGVSHTPSPRPLFSAERLPNKAHPQTTKKCTNALAQLSPDFLASFPRRNPTNRRKKCLVFSPPPFLFELKIHRETLWTSARPASH